VGNDMLTHLVVASRHLIAESRARNASSRSTIASGRRRVIQPITGGDGTAPQALPDLSGCQVLLVDDDYDSLEVLSIFLQACRAEVLQAKNPPTALAYLETHRPDVIIIDLVIGRVNGVDLLHTIRNDGHPSIPAIGITAFAESFAESNRNAFDAFFRKPIDFGALCTSIQTLTRPTAT
jgi:CheY-like chemotaxis protein